MPLPLLLLLVLLLLLHRPSTLHPPTLPTSAFKDRCTLTKPSGMAMVAGTASMSMLDGGVRIPGHLRRDGAAAAGGGGR